MGKCVPGHMMEEAKKGWPSPARRNMKSRKQAEIWTIKVPNNN
jgi:hypothetical protein